MNKWVFLGIFLVVLLLQIFLFGYDDLVLWGFNCFFIYPENLLKIQSQNLGGKCCDLTITDESDWDDLTLRDEDDVVCENSPFLIDKESVFSRTLQIFLWLESEETFAEIYRIIYDSYVTEPITVTCGEINDWIIDRYGSGNPYFVEPFVFTNGDLIKISITNALDIDEDDQYCNPPTDEVIGGVCQTREYTMSCPFFPPTPLPDKKCETPPSFTERADDTGCKYIASSIAEKLPSYGRYGEKYKAGCMEVVYYHVSPTGTPSWTCYRKGAYEFDNIHSAELLKKEFPQYEITIQSV